MNINDDRSACSDSWMMLFVTDETEYGYEHGLGDEAGPMNTQSSAKGELINQGVEANTLYGVYVQTKLVNHPGARNAISKILFVKTLFASPVSYTIHIIYLFYFNAFFLRIHLG